MVIVGLPYTCSPVYQFPEPAPFRGARFYNPYERLRGQWQRANLHAHGQAWGGLTNGQQSSAHVARTYKSLGYDIAGVSNYHAIAAHEGIDTLALYEHGYNIRKRHQLAIGARQVDWLDFPLWQSRSQQQFVIDRVASTADLVGLTHPDTRNAYAIDDLSHLTGYHYIEVVNGPFTSTAPWDAALSAGHAVWAMANDDTHDTGDPRRTAAAWTMIDAASTRSQDVIPALRAGRAIAVSRGPDESTGMDVVVTRVAMTGDTLSVATEGEASDIEFVADGGQARATSNGVHTATYTFTAQDSYVRTVIRTPQTTLFLNPVVRAHDDAVPAAAAVIDGPRTWALRLAAIGVLAAAAFWLWPAAQPSARRDELRATAAHSVQESD